MLSGDRACYLDQCAHARNQIDQHSPPTPDSPASAATAGSKPKSPGSGNRRKSSCSAKRSGLSAMTQAGRSSFEGSSNAAPSPISPIRIREASAQAYDRYPGATTDTMIVPAIAVPNDEPRFETLRESPEISPCSASGKLD